MIPLQGVGNRQTFMRQIEILLDQNDSDTVYFAEDDYFYLPGQFACTVQFLRDNPDADFVSPYDHPDYYRLPLHSESQETRTQGEYNWRTAASTCLTFLTRKQTLAETQKVFRTYNLRNPDVCLWLSLTKQAVLDPTIIRRCFRRRE